MLFELNYVHMDANNLDINKTLWNEIEATPSTENQVIDYLRENSSKIHTIYGISQAIAGIPNDEKITANHRNGTNNSELVIQENIAAEIRMILDRYVKDGEIEKRTCEKERFEEIVRTVMDLPGDVPIPFDFQREEISLYKVTNE